MKLLDLSLGSQEYGKPRGPMDTATFMKYVMGACLAALTLTLLIRGVL